MFLTQMEALKASSQSYDSGNKWEAARLANCVFILLHDSSTRSRSLFSQLGIRGSTRFVSYAFPHNPNNLLRSENLVGMQISSDGTSEYIPLFQLTLPSAQRKELQFHNWWEDEIIFYDPDTLFLNRRRLVWALRNQDGGAHVDESITDPAYVRISKGTKGGWFSRVNGIDRPLLGAHLAAMRQIAWEVQETVSALGPIS